MLEWNAMFIFRWMVISLTSGPLQNHVFLLMFLSHKQLVLALLQSACISVGTVFLCKSIFDLPYWRLMSEWRCSKLQGLEHSVSMSRDLLLHQNKVPFTQFPNYFRKMKDVLEKNCNCKWNFEVNYLWKRKCFNSLNFAEEINFMK